MRKFFVFFSVLLSVAAGDGQANVFQKKFPQIDRYIDSLMKDWNIPGLALGIVYKDQLIYARGYGYRDLENKLPVESTTIFPIASNTKLFTATAACMLVVEGKLDLDKPVRNYLPSLHFYNDELDTKVTLRDMLSHRTGLPRYDGIWVASPFNRREVVEKIAFMKPALGFREGYIYNNIMFAAAGTVMESILNMRWEDIVRTKIFQPLQMNASCFTNEDMKKTGNFAYAYFEPDSTRKLQRIVFEGQSEAVGAAGIIKSNIVDMSHWMIAQLNEGNYKEQKAIPAAAIKQTLIPNNIAEKEMKWEELSNPLYCLGRTVAVYKGYKIATHTGSIDGYYSNLTFIPAEHLAIFMVHNSAPAGSIRSMMAFPILDRLLDLGPTPWSERYMKDYLTEKAASKKTKDSINATRIQHTIPSHALRDYAGKYVNPIYGELIIEWRQDRLMLSFHKQQSILQHFHYDQFVTQEDSTGNPDFRLSFLTGSKGTIERVQMRPYGDAMAEFVKSDK